MMCLSHMKEIISFVGGVLKDLVKSTITLFDRLSQKRQAQCNSYE